MAASGFRGTSVEQDGRWGKTEEKLLQEMTKQGKFAPILDSKVNMKKVNMEVISKWITQKIILLVRTEDEILINMVINLLQAPEVHPKRMQITLTPFLERNTPLFVEELWSLLVDAQSQPSGIPSSILEKKKQEILSRAPPTRATSPPGRLTSSGIRPNTSPPSIRTVIREQDERKRAESRSARVHRPREQAPVQHEENEKERERARSRRHGLDERSQSTRKRPLAPEEEVRGREGSERRQRFPSRHHDRRDARRSPPKVI
eukprot:gene8339-9192_t